MTVSITDRDQLLTNEMRQFAERRLFFALSRFESKIETVSLLITDENGPRGGIDKLCKLVIRLRHLNEIVISDKDANVSACVARLAQRAGRAVSRSVDRSQRFQRHAPQSAEPSGLI